MPAKKKESEEKEIKKEVGKKPGKEKKTEIEKENLQKQKKLTRLTIGEGLKYVEEWNKNFIAENFKDKEFINEIKPGTQVKAHLVIREGDKSRVQIFDGIVISINGSGNDKTFTVRKISSGIGVERIIPFLSPALKKIEIVRKFKVRRAKLYYLRKQTGKAAKLKEIIETNSQ